MSRHVDEERRTFDFAEGPYTVCGAVVTCRCGRRFLVDATLFEPRALPRLGGCCLECVDLSDEFRRDHPEITGAIDRWVAESPGEEGR